MPFLKNSMFSSDLDHHQFHSDLEQELEVLFVESSGIF